MIFLGVKKVRLLVKKGLNSVGCLDVGILAWVFEFLAFLLELRIEDLKRFEQRFLGCAIVSSKDLR